jgi:hypothetical protein
MGGVPFWYQRQYLGVEVRNPVVSSAHRVSLRFLLWGEPGRVQRWGGFFWQAVKLGFGP